MALTFSQTLIAFLVLGLSWTSLAESRRELQVKSVSAQHSHTKWVSSQRRVYKDEAEKEKRQNIFNENAKFVEEFNSQANRTFKLSTNDFADLTNEEFQQSRTSGFKMSNLTRTTTSEQLFITQSLVEDSSIPNRIDWRERNAVTPIKNQGFYCGSCWAFASVAATEGLTYIKTGRLPSLSEQQLVDCVTQSHGCKGGNQNDAFNYIIQNGGITSESNYPYTARTDSCETSPASQHAAAIRGFVELPENDEAAIRYAVSKQPVVAVIDSRGKEFQFYSGGVFTGNCGTTLDHAITIVGYGRSQEGIDYWLIKNSWGTGWGENGYMRLQRNAGFKQGRCGIAMYSSYPTF